VARFVGIRNLFRGDIVRGKRDEQEFVSPDIRLAVLTDVKGGAATALVRSEDVVISTTKPVSSARNVIEGVVTDILPARLGMEVTVEAGTEIAALLTRRSVEQLGLEKGMTVFASIKASAVSIIED
jgi:molybdopterin-binding protein